MALITHKTPSAYWNRHPDWYQGWFKSVAHAVGLVGEYNYYWQMESQARAAKDNAVLSWLLGILGGVLSEPIGNFFVALYSKAYEVAI